MPQSPRNAIVTYRSFGGAFDAPGSPDRTLSDRRSSRGPIRAKSRRFARS